MTTPKKRQALISLVNQISNDDPTAFEGKYVPEVTEEMVINYLTSGKTIVPNTDNVKPSDINSKYRESFMPKTTAFEKAPVEEKNNLTGLHQGIRDGVERTYANRTLIEQQDVRAAEERGEVISEQVAEAPKVNSVQIGNNEPQTIAPQAQAQTRPPEVPTLNYQSIFPNDPLGEMIAKRNELRNRQT
jgi:ribosomal protein L35AE/L33A